MREKRNRGMRPTRDALMRLMGCVSARAAVLSGRRRTGLKNSNQEFWEPIDGARTTGIHSNVTENNMGLTAACVLSLRVPLLALPVTSQYGNLSILSSAQVVGDKISVSGQSAQTVRRSIAIAAK